MSLYEEALFNDAALAAYYRFESGALTTDESGNGHTLTAISDPALTTGRFGGAVDLDGNDAYSAVDHADFKPTGNFTIGTWVKTTTATASWLFQSRAWASSKLGGISLHVNSDGTALTVSARNTGQTLHTDYEFVASTITVNDGNWHFLTATWDGSYLRLYIDGRLNNTVTWSYAPAYQATNYVRIGVNCNTGTNANFLTGSLDDLFLFNGKALSASEVESLYYHLKDVALNLQVYGQNLSDFEAWLQVHDGLELRNFRALLDAISATLVRVDMPLGLYVTGQSLEALKMHLFAAKDKHSDFAAFLSATNFTINDFAAFLSVTDGNVLKDFGTNLQVIGAIPVFRSVTAHRVSSVIHEVA